MANTQAQEIDQLLSVTLEGVYPGQNTVITYYDRVKMLIASPLPTPPDNLLRHIVSRTLNVRNPNDSAMFLEMAPLERIDLVDDLIRTLTADEALLTAYIAALATYKATLPTS